MGIPITIDFSHLTFLASLFPRQSVQERDFTGYFIINQVLSHIKIKTMVLLEKDVWLRSVRW